MPWADKTTVKKGDIGESIVDAYLKSRGLIPYAPVTPGAHPFDRLCATADKRRIFIAETKAKARRTYYPDTGINERNFNDYMRIIAAHGIAVWLMFVDEHEGRIYGGSLERLSRERVVTHKDKTLVYPIRSGGVIYFPLESMTHISDIPKNEAVKLKALSQRNYEYAN